MKRIRNAGGSVNSKNRLYGDLAVSRAFGDIYHKGDVLKQDGEQFIATLADLFESMTNTNTSTLHKWTRA